MLSEGPRIDMLREREGGLCFYCQETPKKETIDHVIPKAMGGGVLSNNVVYCCWDCNHQKGDSLLDDWYVILKDKMSKKELSLAVDMVEEGLPGQSWRLS